MALTELALSPDSLLVEEIISESQPCCYRASYALRQTGCNFCTQELGLNAWDLRLGLRVGGGAGVAANERYWPRVCRSELCPFW